MDRWYKDGQVFNSVQAIRNDNKEVSLPHFMSDSVLADMGYLKVVDNGQPAITPVQTIQDGGILLVDGVPTQVWNTVDMFADTPEETVADITPAVLDVDGVTVITPEVVTVTVVKPAKTKLEYETEYLGKLQAEEVAKMVQHFTDVTTNYIEAKVQEYNKANGLAFNDIDAFTKYAVTPTSVHNTIANRFISYADKVWNTVRTYQATATTMPTDAEFKALLDSVVF